MLRRVSLLLAALVAAGTVSTAAPAASIDSCDWVVLHPYGACVQVENANPLIARAFVHDPHGTSTARAGFVRSEPPGGACGDPTKTQPIPLPPLPIDHQLPPLPPLTVEPPLPPLPLPALPVDCRHAMLNVYEIAVDTETPRGHAGARAVGSPAPCTSTCQYDVNVYATPMVDMSRRICYSVPGSVILSC
ncbi:MAG TPA: hypothetical protein VM841_03120 [Actinomycetota bacterium]|nr:hypothetical protein [Actinomycetota bacterium]